VGVWLTASARRSHLMHANARPTTRARLELCREIARGPSVASVAAEFRLADHGLPLVGPLRGPSRGRAGRAGRPVLTASALPSPDLPSGRGSDRGAAPPGEARAARIAYRLGLNPATVHRVLVRHRLNRLDWLHAPTGRVIRRYEHPAPGDLIHIDVKKLGVIPPGGGSSARRDNSAYSASPPRTETDAQHSVWRKAPPRCRASRCGSSRPGRVSERRPRPLGQVRPDAGPARVRDRGGADEREG
jgi:hypothetical protein